MSKTAVFKVQQPDGRSWEDTDITWVQIYNNAQQPQVAAKAMANLTGRQVRWNWEGSLRGNWAHPDHILAMPRVGGVK